MPAFFYRLPVRIYAMAVLALAVAAALTVFLLSQATDDAYKNRYRQLNEISGAAISLLDEFEEGVRSGEYTREQAQELAQERLTTLRFGESGYFYAFDTDFTVQVHPYKPEWIGTVKRDFVDPGGIQVFVELGKIATEHGSGDMFHYFVNPATGNVERKIGYVTLYGPWNWIIGTGSYTTDIQNDIARMRNVAFLALAAGLALLSAAAYFIARSITKPIDRICNDMEAVAAGDLTVEIADADRADEVGRIGKTLVSMQEDLRAAKASEAQRAEMQEHQDAVVARLTEGLRDLAAGDFSRLITKAFPAEHDRLRVDFNKTAETLNDTIAQVIDTAESIRNGAGEISQASDELSNRTESQAATLEETAAALDELTASVKSAADGARSVESTMEDAKGEARSSGEVVQSAVAAMTEIEQSSAHISQIISVIDDIAFQTNLLALNAGVEAARAGEAGRGFAVVASEVRALAQRSSDAAMEIKTLIGNSSQQVGRGVDLVGKAGEALQSIVSQVGHISQLVSGIAEGAAEQSTGLGEINTGMTQLDQVTQQNAAMVEQATAAGHLLKTDASKLSDLVSHFRLIGGSKLAAPARAAGSPAPAPSAHGSGDWDIKPAPQPAAMVEGNAARDLWQDF